MIKLINETSQFNEDIERPTIDEMRERLREFATNENRIGFEPANTTWNEETLYDFYMDDGFYATANLEDMKGYFTWSSPSGNGYDLTKEFNFNEDYGFDHFLNAITDYSYDNSLLIEEVLKNCYNFTEPVNWRYEKDFDGSDGNYHALWDANSFDGIIEGETVEDGTYANEFDNFVAFIEELEYLMK